MLIFFRKITLVNLSGNIFIDDKVLIFCMLGAGLLVLIQRWPFIYLFYFLLPPLLLCFAWKVNCTFYQMLMSTFKSNYLKIYDLFAYAKWSLWLREIANGINWFNKSFSIQLMFQCFSLRSSFRLTVLITLITNSLALVYFFDILFI